MNPSGYRSMCRSMTDMKGYESMFYCPQKNLLGEKRNKTLISYERETCFSPATIIDILLEQITAAVELLSGKKARFPM